MADNQGWRVFLRYARPDKADKIRMVGTIVDTDFDIKGSSLKVVWDNGVSEYFDKCSLEQSEIVPIEAMRYGATSNKSCDECQNLIHGFLWNCIQCNNIDICTRCYMADCHDVAHLFKRLLGNDPNSWKILPARKMSQRIRLVGLFPGATVLPNMGQNNMALIGNSKKGALTNYEQSNKFKFSSVCVVWSDSPVQSVYFLGKDHKVDVRCLIPGTGLLYYEDHLPSLHSVRSNDDVMRSRSISVQLPDNYIHSSSHFCQKSLQIFQNEFLSTTEVNETPTRKSKSLEELDTGVNDTNSWKEIHAQMARKKSTLVTLDKAPGSSNFIKTDKETRTGKLDSLENQAEISSNDIHLLTAVGKRKNERMKNKKKNQLQLSKITKCYFCERRAIAITFQPCGHSMVCVNCACYFKRCFVCQSQILRHWKMQDQRCKSDKNNSIEDKRVVQGDAVTQKQEMVQNLVYRMEDLRSRLTRVESCFICNVCQINKKNVSFQCGHSTCEECSEMISNCSVCKAVIRVKTFYEQNLF